MNDKRAAVEKRMRECRRTLQSACFLVLLLEALPVGAQVPRSIERADAPPPPRGPTRPSAELPPRGPVCPGEPRADSSSGACQDREITDSAKEASRSEEAPQEIVKETDKAVPDPPIDADRKPEKRNVEDQILWLPRLALSPLYLVSEYVLRRPFGWFIRLAERKGWPEAIVDFLTFGPEDNAGIVPTALFDFGFRPSVGIYGFWNDAAAPGHDIRVRAATGGSDWWQLVMANRSPLSSTALVELRGAMDIRPDRVFYGLGAHSSDRENRYFMERYDLEVTLKADWWRTSRFEGMIGFRHAQFDATRGCCGDSTLAEAVREGRLEQPPGLSGYTIFREGLRLQLDSRKSRMLNDHSASLLDSLDFMAPPGDGAKLELTAVGSHRLALAGEAEDSRAGLSRSNRISPFWLNYGVTLGGYLALPGYQRTVGLEITAELTDPVAPGEIPFTEQARLGGERVLRGFFNGRLVDRSALGARLRYHWPVWALLDGVVEYGAGSVFGQRFENFDFGWFYQSFAFGLGSSTKRDHSFQFLFALGMSHFDGNSELDTVRVVLGGHSGI